MSCWIVAGSVARKELPTDQLLPEELEALRELLAERGRLAAAIHQVDMRLEITVLACRDRRGMAGRIRVDPQTGRIEETEEDQDGQSTESR